MSIHKLVFVVILCSPLGSTVTSQTTVSPVVKLAYSIYQPVVDSTTILMKKGLELNDYIAGWIAYSTGIEQVEYELIVSFNNDLKGATDQLSAMCDLLRVSTMARLLYDSSYCITTDVNLYAELFAAKHYYLATLELTSARRRMPKIRNPAILQVARESLKLLESILSMEQLKDIKKISDKI